MNLNQKDFIKEISADTGYTQGDITRVFESIETNVIKNIKEGNSVKLFSGIVFYPKFVEEHIGRNPRTGETITIPEKILFKTKISEVFKKKISE